MELSSSLNHPTEACCRIISWSTPCPLTVSHILRRCLLGRIAKCRFPLRWFSPLRETIIAWMTRSMQLRQAKLGKGE